MRYLALLAVFLALPAEAVQYAHSQPPAQTRLCYPPGTPRLPGAFFNLSTDNTGVVGWPGDYWPYTLYAGARASSSQSDLTTLRQTKVGATFLAYIGGQNLPDWVSFPNRWNNAIKGVWDSTHFCVYELDSAKVFRVSGLMQWCPRMASIDSLTRVVRDSLYGNVTWDGLYVDELYADYPTFKEDILGTTHFDCDGDGVADSKAKLEAQWHNYRSVLVARLRSVSSTRPIIANVAVATNVADASLNGICIEDIGGGGRPDSTAAMAAFNAQRQIGQMPFIGIAWCESTKEVPSCVKVVERTPGVYLGRSSAVHATLP